MQLDAHVTVMRAKATNVVKNSTTMSTINHVANMHGNIADFGHTRASTPNRMYLY